MLNDLFQIAKYIVGLIIALVILPTKLFINETEMDQMNAKQGVSDGVKFIQDIKDAFNEAEQAGANATTA